jgi:hypothetical protein
MLALSLFQQIPLFVGALIASRLGRDAAPVSSG